MKINDKKKITTVKNHVTPINQKNKNVLFDQTDKPFLLVYLIIFILGIVLTISAIK